MKKTAIVTACILLFGGGLLCFYVIAQTWEGLGVLVFDEPKAPPTSLLDRKLEDCSERELLELKVAVCQKRVRYVVASSEAGSPAGSAIRLAESHADLAAAEIELYKHTGEQAKLRTALQSRVEALTDRLRGVMLAVEGFSKITPAELHEAEMQLLDALLEQKRVLASLNET